MSEQTPDSTANAHDDEGFAASDSEPSMEDILASIRKIISDDADPLPLDGPDVAFLPTPTIVKPVAETPDDDAFDLDSLLGELGEADVSDPEPQSFPDESLAGALGFDDLDDIAIPEIEADAAVTEVISMEDDMDQLMNELLVDMEMPSSDVQPASVLAAGPVAASAVSAASADEDMDIVKSLMADLTDEDLDPSFGSTASDDMDLDALMDELEGFDDEAEATSQSDTVSDSDLDELDAMEEDIFDSILEMTLDDEIEAFDAQSEVDVAVPSLAAIAAEAEAEATSAAIVQSASVLGAELVNAQTSDAKSDESETEQSTADMTDDATRLAPAQPAPSEMEIPMPRALRSDAILDDVTESATMSAFAELNQVVEDKAILSERGPRIGDLVQDALKPMLKEWLDANIQGIVERAVAKEVQRIASGK